jgi:hypothetical protein
MIDQWLNSWDDVSKKIWEKICKRNPPEERDREVFELLASAFIYDVNAVGEFGEEHIHKPIDLSRFLHSEYRYRDFFDASQHPYLFSISPNVKGKGEYFGSMHMASASFRIATAIFLAGKQKTDQKELRTLMKSDGWNRAKLHEYLDKAQPECTGSHELTLKDDLGKSLGLYIAMVVACRDEFGHGEIGDGADPWRLKRGKRFPLFLRCDLIEAHMNLIYMGLMLTV